MSGARRTLKELAAELNTLMKEAREGVVPLAEAKAHLLRVRGQVDALQVPAADVKALEFVVSLKQALDLAEPALGRLSRRELESTPATGDEPKEEEDEEEEEEEEEEKKKPRDQVATSSSASPSRLVVHPAPAAPTRPLPLPPSLGIERRASTSAVAVVVREPIKTRDRSQSRSWDASDGSRARGDVPLRVAPVSPRPESMSGNLSPGRRLLASSDIMQRRASLDPPAVNRDEYVKCTNCSAANRKGYTACRMCQAAPAGKT